ncbi:MULTISPECIES: HNH endonuclease [Pseudomonas]|uniref:HNH endonuclease n=1 Tax=Pseudomonas TaxID=286 RepID=UPI0010672036|nr:MULTISPECIES: HNH endonuclease [Pseudomonas]
MNGIFNEELRSRFKSAAPDIQVAYKSYLTEAKANLLHTIRGKKYEKNDIVLSRLTKDNLMKLYSQYFVGEQKIARKHYNDIFFSSPNQKCPYCGFGQVFTLDHYLSKASHPQFSVLMPNLVPSCRDCNEGYKSDKAGNSESKQFLHPYFEKGYYYEQQWLFAEVKYSVPATIFFYVSCPLNWTESAKSRVRNHFKEFGLQERYAVEAAEELSTLSLRLSRRHKNDSPAQIREILDEALEAEQMKHQNSWKTAMYYALVQSKWYQCEGYKLE